VFVQLENGDRLAIKKPAANRNPPGVAELLAPDNQLLASEGTHDVMPLPDDVTRPIEFYVPAGAGVPVA
jgi:hypothetical protein